MDSFSSFWALVFSPLLFCKVIKNMAFVWISYFSKYDCSNRSVTFLFKKWGYICFIMLCQFLLYNTMNQLQVCTHTHTHIHTHMYIYISLPLEPLPTIAYTAAPHLGSHRAPSWTPCVYRSFPLAVYSIVSNVYVTQSGSNWLGVKSSLPVHPALFSSPKSTLTLFEASSSYASIVLFCTVWIFTLRSFFLV